MAQIQLKLGDKTWTIKSPLKFRQLRLIEPAMSKIIGMKIRGEGTTEKFYDEMANVILAAVSVADKDFTRLDLDELDMDVQEISAASRLISLAAGMWKDPDVDIKKKADELVALLPAMKPEDWAAEIEAALNAQYARGKAEKVGEAQPGATPANPPNQ